MSYPQFSDSTKRLLQRHPSFASTRTRECGVAFTRSQARVCASLAALRYPVDQMMAELERGEAAFFREGSDQDRKEGGKKVGYRFAGISPSLSEEYRQQRAACERGLLAAPQFAAWTENFLLRFTFEVIEQIALRAGSTPLLLAAAGAELASALGEARRIRDEMLSGNLLLAAQIAIRRGRFQHGFTLDELFIAGTDGLLIAINRYDPAVALFSTYATPWISMAIDRFAANHRHVIRLPIGLQEKVRKLGGAVGLIPSTISLEEPISSDRDGAQSCVADVIADPSTGDRIRTSETAARARRVAAAVAALGGLKYLIVALRSEVGDASAAASALFHEEMRLSQSRGRASAEAARRMLDQPARVRLVAEWPATAACVEPASNPLPIAV